MCLAYQVISFWIHVWVVAILPLYCTLWWILGLLGWPARILPIVICLKAFSRKINTFCTTFGLASWPTGLFLSVISCVFVPYLCFIFIYGLYICSLWLDFFCSSLFFKIYLIYVCYLWLDFFCSSPFLNYLKPFRGFYISFWSWLYLIVISLCISISLQYFSICLVPWLVWL